MKKIALVLILSVFAGGGLFAQKPIGNNHTRQHSLEPIESIEADFSGDIEAIFAKKEQEAMIWRSLNESRPDGVDPLMFAPSAEALAELDLAQCETCPVEDEKQRRVLGVNQAVDITVDLGNETIAKRGTGIGQTVRIPNRDLVWSTSLISEDATAIRVRFTNVNLGEDAMLFIYNDYGQAFGPYTGTGPHGNGKFWSHTVHGDQVWIQLHVAPGANLDTVSFHIDALSHMGTGLKSALADQRLGKADCNRNLSCVENARCYDDWSELSGSRKATAYLIYSEDKANGKSYGCSGGTLNDNNSAHRKAWLLTARHCISTEAEADSLEARFGYKSDACGTCASSISDSILGSDIRATGSGDFTLLELPRLPSGWGLLGSTSATVRNKDGMQLYRISHPVGSPQSFSQHEVDTAKFTDTKWIYSLPVIGTTEGQSSGSPLFKAGGTVVGQLGGTSWTGSSYDLCQNPATNWRFRDGALSHYWKSVRPYLASASNTSFKMHVTEVTVGTRLNKLFGFNYYKGVGTVTVRDELGHAVPGVTVTGEFTGGLSGSFTATTNYKGEAVVVNSLLKKSKPNFTFCVTNLTHDYFNTYDSGANLATCATR